jgi:Holliday junction resolvase-like predicted endonuclease
MNTARKGRRAEHKARMILRADGFEVIRAAASKGVADLVAWNAETIVFVSVKSGVTYASAEERAALRGMRRPTNSRVEIWRFPNRCVAPVIERIT